MRVSPGPDYDQHGREGGTVSSVHKTSATRGCCSTMAQRCTTPSSPPSLRLRQRAHSCRCYAAETPASRSPNLLTPSSLPPCSFLIQVCLCCKTEWRILTRLLLLNPSAVLLPLHLCHTPSTIKHASCDLPRADSQPITSPAPTCHPYPAPPSLPCSLLSGTHRSPGRRETGNGKPKDRPDEKSKNARVRSASRTQQVPDQCQPSEGKREGAAAAASAAAATAEGEGTEGTEGQGRSGQQQRFLL